jgi:hypothetical protein
VKPRLILAGWIALAVILGGGCTSPPEVVTTRLYTVRPYNPGRILLLPPRDAVQNGQLQPKGAGSGRNLQAFVRAAFAGTPFALLTTDYATFDSARIADKEQCLGEARRMRVNYCMRVVLGEFVDSDPMSFQPDRASLDSAVMWDVLTGETVWELAGPIPLQKVNAGGLDQLLDEHAHTIVKSVCDNVKKE